MNEPIWVERLSLELLHAESIADHGGLAGLRDEGLLEGALTRAINRHFYEGVTDIFVLAATYAAAIAGNHPFFDGNKRAAFIASLLFAEQNGQRIVVDEAEAAAATLALAAGGMTEASFAEWLRSKGPQN